MRNRRVLCLLLAFCMLMAMVPEASADSTFCINGVNINHYDYDSAPDDCWNYANNFYRKVWNCYFSSLFDDSDNFLRNLSDSELTLNPEHLRLYVSSAELGSVLRVCDSKYLHSYDNEGHSQLIVQKDANGFTVFEGGLSAYPYHREKYFTWDEYCSTGYLSFGYIKYIKWPGAPVFTAANAYLSKCSISPTLAKVEVPQNAGYLKSLPCSEKTDADSKTLGSGTLKAGETFTINAIVTNSVGNVWYRTTYDGKDAYLYSGDVVVKEVLFDAAISADASYPRSSIAQGTAYSLAGTITSSHKLQKITVSVYPGADTLSAPVLRAEEKIASKQRYNISAAIDQAITFNTLSPGTYLFEIRVQEMYDDPGRLACYTRTTSVVSQTFTVVGAGGQQDSGTLTPIASKVSTASATPMPGKAVLNVSVSGNTATFTWANTANTTHYNFWMYKKDASGNWAEADHTFYVSSGMTRSVSDGEYRALVQSYDSNHWFSDGRDWLYVESDYVYFTVGKQSSGPSLRNFKDKGTYRQGQFKDVPAGKWYTDAVAKTYALGLFKGVSTDKFDPTGEVTVAQAIALAARMHSIYYGGSGEFKAASGPWYTPHVNYLKGQGLIPDDFLGWYGILTPADYTQPATRLFVAGLFCDLFRGNDLAPINNVPEGSIPDVQLHGTGNGWNDITNGGEAVYTLYRAGVFCGSDMQRNFKPFTGITRAETATVILRLLRPESRVAFSI